MNKLRSYFRADEGATAVEYGIMVALIAAVIIGVVVLVGNQTKDAFDCVGQTMSTGETAEICDGED